MVSLLASFRGGRNMREKCPRCGTFYRVSANRFQPSLSRSMPVVPIQQNGHDLARRLRNGQGHSRRYEMKLKNVWAAPLALGMLVASQQITPALQAQSKGKSPETQQQD